MHYDIPNEGTFETKGDWQQSEKVSIWWSIQGAFFPRYEEKASGFKAELEVELESPTGNPATDRWVSCQITDMQGQDLMGNDYIVAEEEIAQ